MHLRAIITDRHTHENPNGKSLCVVKCPGCGLRRVFSYGGWSTLGCRCGATLHRFQKQVDSARQEQGSHRPLDLLDHIVAFVAVLDPHVEHQALLQHLEGASCS